MKRMESQMTIHTIDYLKRIVRKYNWINGMIWFLYSRVMYSVRTTLMLEVTKDGNRDFGYTSNSLYRFLNESGYLLYFLHRGSLKKLSQSSFSTYHGNFFAFPRGKEKPHP